MWSANALDNRCLSLTHHWLKIVSQKGGHFSIPAPLREADGICSICICKNHGVLHTLPETNSSPLKIDGLNSSFLLGWPIFRGYVRLLECIIVFPRCKKNLFISCRWKKVGLGHVDISEACWLPACHLQAAMRGSEFGEVLRSLDGTLRDGFVKVWYSYLDYRNLNSKTFFLCTQKKCSKGETWMKHWNWYFPSLPGAYPVEPGESPVRRMPRLLSGCAVQASWKSMGKSMGKTSR